MKNVVSLTQLFQERILRIPDYQRGYSWQDQQRQDLIDDLELLAAGADHYTGTVVLHESERSFVTDESGERHHVRDVVDGQQRLTSLVILLDSMRRQYVVHAPGSARAKGIRARFVQVRLESGLEKTKLQLARDLAPFFEKSVLGEKHALQPENVPQQRLRAAREQFDLWLAKEMEERGVDAVAWLDSLHTKVTQHLRMTVYDVESTAEVGIIFEVMNNRGKPLSELEKVKNNLLYVAAKLDEGGSELADRINGTWSRLLRLMMRAGVTSTADEDRLLRAHWLLTEKPDRRAWSGARSPRQLFDLRGRAREKHSEVRQRIVGYLESLELVATAFVDIERPASPGAFGDFGGTRADAREWTQKLHRMGLVGSVRQVLLAARLRATPAEYVELVRASERYAFRVYRVRERRSDAGRVELDKCAYRLFQHASTADDLVDRIDGLAKQFCPDEEFADEMGPGHFYGWAGLRYLLYEWELELLGRVRKTPEVSWRDLTRKKTKQKTLEHILPQHPGKGWGRVSKKQRAKWTHDLGNLVLTEDNSSYGNKAFKAKRGDRSDTHPCYARSRLLQEQELAKLDSWDVAAIKERRERLVAWAQGRWGLPEGDEE